MAIEYWGYGKRFESRDDALAAIDEADVNTDGMIWNGEKYYDREMGISYWPVDSYEVDKDGQIIQGVERLGYIVKN